MCSLSHLKCQRFCNRMLFLCHKYQRGKHGAIPQESNDSKTQLHCPSKPSVRDCVHLHKLGEQTRVLFCRLKEHTAFFPLMGFHELQRMKIHLELLLLFVFNIFQIRPRDLSHSFSLILVSFCYKAVMSSIGGNL